MIFDLLSPYLQAVGVACGLSGALFVASGDRDSRRLGFCLWLISDAAWLGAGICLSNLFLFVQFGFYFLTAAYGLRNNLPVGRAPWQRS